MTLAQRVVALHRALARKKTPHAFGGAIALAYWTREPRGTRDIDVNVFVPAREGSAVLGALPPGFAVTEETAETIAADGQVRVWWDDTPVDLFFDNVPVHADAARHVRVVPFAGARIPILGPVELAVFKAMFDRTRDWADIEAMVAASTLDLDAVRSVLATVVEPEDHRFARVDEAVRRAQQQST